MPKHHRRRLAAASPSTASSQSPARVVPVGAPVPRALACRPGRALSWPPESASLSIARSVPLAIPLLLLAACRAAAPAPPATTAPAAAPVSLLAGFDAPTGDDDPTAQEAAKLSEGPLAAAAQTEAPDMQLEGDLIATRIGPGQLFEQEFRLQPGRCYTLLAVGGEGIRELDAALEAQNPVRGKRTALIEDSTTGTTAIVGGGATCFPWAATAEPQTVKFVLRVRDGDGVVVSQLYAKPL